MAHNGFLFGQFGIQQFDSPTAQLKCIDMRTGQVKWSTNGFGRGGTLLVDDHLLVLSERGDLILAQPNTNAYTELARFLAIPNYFGDTNKCWNTPAVAEGRVYIRSTSFGACYDLAIPALKLDAPMATAGSKLSITVRTVNGTPIGSNRVTQMKVRSSTNVAIAPSQWAQLTNVLALTNGTARATNVDLGPAGPPLFYRRRTEVANHHARNILHRQPANEGRARVHVD